MYKVIIFDFFGVFCTSMASNWFNKTAPDASEKASAFQELCTLSDLGKLSRSEFNERAALLSGVGPDEVERGIEAEKAIDADLVEYAQSLKRQGYRLACLSNGSHEWTLKVINDHEMGHLFEDVILSGDLGIIKPDPAIYHYALKKLGITGPEALFVDDRQINIDGAEACGIKGLLFKDTPTFMKDFSSITK